MRRLAHVLSVIAAASACVAADYVPPKGPRSEAKFGALYRELRGVDGAAAGVADKLYPDVANPGASVPRRERLDGWSAAHEKELNRRLDLVARKLRTSREELVDIRMEGDAFAWFTDPAKRARLGKSEAEIWRDLQSQRESRALLVRKQAEKETAKSTNSRSKAALDIANGKSDGEGRAAIALNAGELLEKSGKIANATKAYQGVIRDYPGTKAAEKARMHLDALSGKP